MRTDTATEVAIPIENKAHAPPMLISTTNAEVPPVMRAGFRYPHPKPNPSAASLSFHGSRLSSEIM